MRGCWAASKGEEANGSGENLHSRLAMGESRDAFAALGVGASVAKNSKLRGRGAEPLDAPRPPSSPALKSVNRGRAERSSRGGELLLLGEGEVESVWLAWAAAEALREEETRGSVI